MPAYMGIYFRPLSDGQRKRYRTARGAVSINNVNPDSPAAEAGLKVSDIVLGPAGAPFTEPEQIREWTMHSEIGVPVALDILREGAPMRVTLRPGPYPLALPKLPGPPKVGSTAPPLKVEMYPEPRVLAEHRPRLLFFWATWCAICKQALPEVMAFAQARDIDVLAITDEDPEVLEGFFREFVDPFPALVATDPQRLTFQAYGVSGTPSFVLLDAEGIVQYTQTGYRMQEGLRVEGWKWRP
jgi:thiol-disulfide isomerase/thioredoxin